jgi:putative DNA primase/helicase
MSRKVKGAPPARPTRTPTYRKKEDVLTQVYTDREGVATANIPEPMKTYRHWLCWRLEERDGKPTKIPYDPLTGRHASSTDSRTWRSFEEALAAMEVGAYDGLGFVFSSGDPYTGIDLDGCRDPETSELEPWAAAIVAESEGYAEASPSGTGVHIIVRGKAPNKKRGRVECYSERRFFTMTGRAL